MLKDEEGARFFIIDNSRPTETWRLGLAEISWAQEMVDLANRAHQAELMDKHLKKMSGETQVRITITDLEQQPCIRQTKVEFDKQQAQGVYKGVMVPAVQAPSGEFYRMAFEGPDNETVLLTRAYVETAAKQPPEPVHVPETTQQPVP